MQRLSVDELHRIEVYTPFLADSEHRDHIGMLNMGRSLGFMSKTEDLSGIEHGGKRQDLERHAAVQRNLACFIDNPHAAAADFAANFKIANPPPAALIAGGGILLGINCCLESARHRVQFFQTVKIVP